MYMENKQFINSQVETFKHLLNDDTFSEYFEHLPVIPEPEDLGDKGQRQLGEAGEDVHGALLLDQENCPDHERGEDGETDVDGADDAGNSPVVGVFESPFVLEAVVSALLDQVQGLHAFNLVKTIFASFDGLVELLVELAMTLDEVCCEVTVGLLVHIHSKDDVSVDI